MKSKEKEFRLQEPMSSNIHGGSTNHYVYVDPNEGISTVEWVEIDPLEQEESKWQTRAHLGEIEEEIKSLRDTIVIYGTVNLIVSAAALGGLLVYVFLH